MLHEAGIWIAMRLLDIDYKRFEDRNRSKRTKKGRDSIPPIDAYKLKRKLPKTYLDSDPTIRVSDPESQVDSEY